MTTRLSSITTTILSIALLLTACGFPVINGSGKIITEERPVGDFTAIHFTGFGELILVQGDQEALTITTDDNLLPYLKTRVSQGTLTIAFDEQGWTPLVRPTQSMRYHLTVKTLTHLDLSGAATVAADRFNANQLTLIESGAGEIRIADLTANQVTVEMSGAGTVDLAGKVTAQTVEISGFGAYRAGDLTSQTAQVTLSGAGEATVWVHEQLDAELSGAGTIRYYGSPRLTADSSGIGNIKHLGDK